MLAIVNYNDTQFIIIILWCNIGAGYNNIVIVCACQQTSTVYYIITRTFSKSVRRAVFDRPRLRFIREQRGDDLTLSLN